MNMALLLTIREDSDLSLENTVHYMQGRKMEDIVISKIIRQKRGKESSGSYKGGPWKTS